MNAGVCTLCVRVRVCAGACVCHECSLCACALTRVRTAEAGKVSPTIQATHVPRVQSPVRQTER